MKVINNIRETTISAKIIRANGDTEDLGVISRTKVGIVLKIIKFIKKWLQS